MSKKQWMVLLMLFATYLLLGASIFYHIESRLEIQHVEKAKLERIEINALLHRHYMPDRAHNQHEILEKLTQYCGKSVYNYTEGESDPLKWDFYNSFYFAYTVVSTIGYGNLAPTNMLSRILMIFYGLVGIPMNGILLSQLGEFFSQVFIRAHKKYKTYKERQCDYPKKLAPLESRKAGLAAQIFMYLMPGFIMFIFFPAFLFSHYEGWSYDEAVYYAFVTLTTIGFGDYVAGQDNTKGSGVLFMFYKTFLICWISFGLGYIVMIMTFIARGMRSKKITRIEHKLAMNLKHTQSKIWNEFNKEVNYLRRVFNELQLSKVKRVYVDEYDYEMPQAKCPRSNSFPDLRDLVYGGLEIPAPPHPRRRANSEVVPMEHQVTRVVSETDLQRIDKTATFATHAMVQPAELLARLVNILGYIPPPDDPADSPDEQECDVPTIGHGTNTKDAMANENKWDTAWKIGNEPFPKPRSRAVSEVRLEMDNESNMHQQNGEWTWSGPAASRKIQELIKARRTGLSGIRDAKSKFPTLALPKSVPKTLFPRWIKQFSTKKGNDDSPKNEDVANNDVDPQDTYSAHTTTNVYPTSARESRDSTTRPYFTHTGANLPSYLEGNNLLEETSLADFLRALTALHSRVGAVPEDYVNHKPQRKLGTASLTPPKLPSLLALFSPPTTTSSDTQSNQNTVTGLSQSPRRYSLMATNNTLTNTSNYARRGSLAVAPKPRRFSLRPVVTPIGTPPLNGSPYLSNGRRVTEGQGSPPYSPTNSAFVVDSPKEPLVQREGAPGVSSPVTSKSNSRRFSLRPAQIGVPPAPASPKSSHVKAIPRWKAGMLQRQIGQLSLHKRSRAFSLSDVNTDELNRGVGISPLVLADNRTVMTSLKDTSNKSGNKSNGSSTQKTVTIVSPDQENPRVNDEMQQSSKPVQSKGQEMPNWENTQTGGLSGNSFKTSTVNPFIFYKDISKNDSKSEGRLGKFEQSETYGDRSIQQGASNQTCYTNNAFHEDTSLNLPLISLASPTYVQSKIHDFSIPQEANFPDKKSSVLSTIPSCSSLETKMQVVEQEVPSPTFSRNEAININLQKSFNAKKPKESPEDLTMPVNVNKNIDVTEGVKGFVGGEVAKDDKKINEMSSDKELLKREAKAASRKTSTISEKSVNSEGKSSRKISPITIGTWDDAQKQRKASASSQHSTASSARKKNSFVEKAATNEPTIPPETYKPLLEVSVGKPFDDLFEQQKPSTTKTGEEESDDLTEVKIDKTGKSTSEDKSIAKN